MSDARLQSLYRRLTADRGDAHVVDADAIVEALQRHGYPDEEGTALDRIAHSAIDADVLRVALALAPDAAALSREVAALRAPRRATQAPARRWLALAASIGALAVLFAMMRSGPQSVPSPMAPLPSDSILSVSFESAPGDGIQIREAAPIFSADFDS